MLKAVLSVSFSAARTKMDVQSGQRVCVWCTEQENVTYLEM